jgi:2Fe-2S iron-sulfur cluster binding domain
MTVTLLDRARGDVAPAGETKADARMPVNMKLRVNGREHRLTLDGRTTLLDALREDVNLTGTKKGCDHGQCGACTVFIDNRRVLSCLSFAMTAEGREITMIEGLAKPDGACTRCNKLSSITMRSSAATARPVRSCQPSRACMRAMPKATPRSAST